MYLTRFRINTARAGARRLLSSPQMLHAAVMASFPGALPSDDDSRRVLWRVDHKARAEVFLYIVSPARPDLTHLVEQAGWPAAARTGWKTYDYRPFLARLTKDDIWAFRLTANPVHHIRRHPYEPSKPTAHITPRHQIRWLLQRQEAAGFRVLEKPGEERRLPEGDEHHMVVHNRRSRTFSKSEEGSGRRRHVTVAAATFDGLLEVTDPIALRRTLTTGLGRAKAYGCGLMTLSAAG